MTIELKKQGYFPVIWKNDDYQRHICTRILNVLKTRPTITNADLAPVIGLSQSRTSEYTRFLASEGYLLVASKTGNRYHYALNKKNKFLEKNNKWPDIYDFIEGFASFLIVCFAIVLIYVVSKAIWGGVL